MPNINTMYRYYSRIDFRTLRVLGSLENIYYCTRNTHIHFMCPLMPGVFGTAIITLYEPSAKRKGHKIPERTLKVLYYNTTDTEEKSPIVNAVPISNSI